jgi:hypothetical protein
LCNEGWKGPDCSSVSCPSNPCSGHGQCIAKSGGVDHCTCEEGWTGTYCTISTKLLDVLPYGEAFPNITYWHGTFTIHHYDATDDQYEDRHPVFNISELGDVRISLDESSFESLIAPPHLYHQHWINGERFLM